MRGGKHHVLEDWIEEVNRKHPLANWIPRDDN